MPILYHLGKRPPRPLPRRHGGKWERRNRKGLITEDSVVFLSPNPEKIVARHGLPHTFNVYAYDVPMSVIREIGGIHKCDEAPEIMIPKRLWSRVRFLGRSRPMSIFDIKRERERGRSNKFFNNKNVKFIATVYPFGIIGRQTIGWAGDSLDVRGELILTSISKSRGEELSKDKKYDLVPIYWKNRGIGTDCPNFLILNKGDKLIVAQHIGITINWFSGEVI